MSTEAVKTKASLSGGEAVRGLRTRWVSPAPHELGVAELPLVRRLLHLRGMTTPEARDRFLNPTFGMLHDPGLLPNADIAAERIVRALRENEPIVIYGDYDADGITATTVLFHTFKAISPQCPVSTYVPHRFEEGYGLNAPAMEELARRGTKLVVSVDCGITAVAAADAARAAGMDLIITDHHEGPTSLDALPRAFTIVHPRFPGSAYPAPEISGAGVAFKLACRILRVAAPSGVVPPEMRQLMVRLIGVAAIGTIADVVPLLGENRVIARLGLQALSLPGNSDGIASLIEVCGLDGKVTDTDVGFRIGPHLNAVGRLGHAGEAVELLTTASGLRAVELTQKLASANRERQKIQEGIVEQACELVEKRGFNRPDHRAIVLEDARWHRGIVGIVCSKLVEKYSRPAILLGQGGVGSAEMWSGSGRSVLGFNLHGALHECRQHLHHFGGHAMAAGLGVEADRLPEFVEAFVRVANREISAADLEAVRAYDTDATLADLNLEAVKHIEQMKPFSRSVNPEPVLRVNNLRIDGRATLMGAGGKHLQMTVRDGQGRAMRVKGWGWGAEVAKLPPGAGLDVLLRVELNRFSGRENIEGTIEDVRILSSATLA